MKATSICESKNSGRSVQNYETQEMIVKLTLIIAALSVTSISNAQNYWKHEGSTATTSITTDGRKGVVFVTLLVYFNPEFNCSPEIGLIMSQGRKLGVYRKHQYASDVMYIRVDLNRRWTGDTLLIEYSNGFELGFRAHKSTMNNVISELKTGNEVKVTTSSIYTEFLFSLNGSNSAIAMANASCH